MSFDVCYFYRKPGKYFSIEKVFSIVRNELPELVQHEFFAKYRGSCPWKLTLDIVQSTHYQADVNHITGDIHHFALGLDGRKTVLTIHDCVTLENSSGLRNWLLKLLWYFLPIRRCASISVISEKTKNEILRMFPWAASKIQVIPDPILPAFQYFTKEWSDFPRVLQIGTKKNKNLERVFEALAGVCCELRIIGSLSNEQRQRFENSTVRFSCASGLTDAEIVAEYQQADVVLFASTYEGFGLPIIEGQATGRAVITSDLSPMKEVSGGAAVLVDPYDPESIRGGVKQVLDNPGLRQHLIARGRENAIKYSAPRIAAEYMKLYEQVFKNYTALASSH